MGVVPVGDDVNKGPVASASKDGPLSRAGQLRLDCSTVASVAGLTSDTVRACFSRSGERPSLSCDGVSTHSSNHGDCSNPVAPSAIMWRPEFTDSYGTEGDGRQDWFRQRKAAVNDRGRGACGRCSSWHHSFVCCLHGNRPGRCYFYEHSGLWYHHALHRRTTDHKLGGSCLDNDLINSVDAGSGRSHRSRVHQHPSRTWATHSP